MLVTERGFSPGGCSAIGNLSAYKRTCVSGGKKCSFFGKFDSLCFLETPVLRFALLPTNSFFHDISVKVHYSLSSDK